MVGLPPSDSSPSYTVEEPPSDSLPSDSTGVVVGGGGVGADLTIIHSGGAAI